MMKWAIFFFVVGLIGSTLPYPIDDSSEESSENSEENSSPASPAPEPELISPQLAQAPNAPETPQAEKAHPEVPLDHICGSMKIGHDGVAKNNDESPYTIGLSSGEVLPEGNITVTISGKGKEAPFRGFIVQGRCGDKPVGSFVDSSVGPVKYYDCAEGHKNAVVYIDMAKKDVQEAELKWTAPAIPCSIDFYVSTVKTYGEFWEKQQSDSPLLVKIH